MTTFKNYLLFVTLILYLLVIEELRFILMKVGRTGCYRIPLIMCIMVFSGVWCLGFFLVSFRGDETRWFSKERRGMLKTSSQQLATWHGLIVTMQKISNLSMGSNVLNISWMFPSYIALNWMELWPTGLDFILKSIDFKWSYPTNI